MDGGKPRRRKGVAAAEQILCVLPHGRIAGARGGAGRAGRAADRDALDRRRQGAARLRHAVLHRRGAADRQRGVDDEIPPPDDRAGHRLGDRRAGARRHLFRLRRGSRPHRRPGQESRALCDADAARARSGRGRQGDAAARGAPEVGAKSRARDGDRAAPSPGKTARRTRARSARATEIMTRKSRSLSDDERALWDTVTRAVAPLRKRKAKKSEEPAVSAAGAPPARPPRGVKVAPAAAQKTRAPPPLVPLGRRMRSKLTRGSEPIDDRIDLHGMTQADAHTALAHFLRRAQQHGARVVLVITGKGARTGDALSERGALKRQVPHWLESATLRPLVIGFESAGATHGGAGALYVRLRRGDRAAGNCTAPAFGSTVTRGPRCACAAGASCALPP